MSLSIPYMGSKCKSANKIYSTIKRLNPTENVLCDLFCGGFAIGAKFMTKGWDVIANDKNKYVVALLRKVLFEGLPEDKLLVFVTRSMFVDIMNNPSNYEDWYVGYVQCIYSFGNNPIKGYLYGKDVEPIKHAAHKLVVDSDSSLIKGLISDSSIELILSKNDKDSRRAELMNTSHILKNRVFECQNLSYISRIEQLERLQQLEILNKSYDEVQIPLGAVIYCDPPYAGTSEYKEGSFNHAEFWEWCRFISKTNKIYISEYSAPPDFIRVLEFEQKSTLQGGTQKHSNQPTEKLFAPIGQDNFKFSHYSKQTLF